MADKQQKPPPVQDDLKTKYDELCRLREQAREPVKLQKKTDRRKSQRGKQN
jgi:hypothetical protein